jgi:hemerythrin
LSTHFKKVYPAPDRNYSPQRIRRSAMSLPSSPAFPWTDQFLLGYGPMDATHREFVDLVAALLSAPDADLPRHLDAFADHAQRHFAEERAWMESTAFPAAECHIDEHEAVLNSVHEVRVLLAGGGHAATCRALAQELVRWFPGHADYMDAALAQWMVKKRMGGIPVVLKRGSANGSARPPTAAAG